MPVLFLVPSDDSFKEICINNKLSSVEVSRDAERKLTFFKLSCYLIKKMTYELLKCSKDSERENDMIESFGIFDSNKIICELTSNFDTIRKSLRTYSYKNNDNIYNLIKKLINYNDMNCGILCPLVIVIFVCNASNIGFGNEKDQVNKFEFILRRNTHLIVVDFHHFNNDLKFKSGIDGPNISQIILKNSEIYTGSSRRIFHCFYNSLELSLKKLQVFNNNKLVIKLGNLKSSLLRMIPKPLFLAENWIGCDNYFIAEIRGFVDLCDLENSVCAFQTVLTYDSLEESLKEKPSFELLLFGSLTIDLMGAICILGNKQYGLISSAHMSSKKSALKLSVYPENFKVPLLKRFEDLSLCCMPNVKIYYESEADEYEEFPFYDQSSSNQDKRYSYNYSSNFSNRNISFKFNSDMDKIEFDMNKFEDYKIINKSDNDYVSSSISSGHFQTNNDYN